MYRVPLNIKSGTFRLEKTWERGMLFHNPTCKVLLWCKEGVYSKNICLMTGGKKYGIPCKRGSRRLRLRKWKKKRKSTASKLMMKKCKRGLGRMWSINHVPSIQTGFSLTSFFLRSFFPVSASEAKNTVEKNSYNNEKKTDLFQPHLDFPNNLRGHEMLYFMSPQIIGIK